MDLLELDDGLKLDELIEKLNEQQELPPLLDPNDEGKIKEIFLESALLPVLESALRSGSILEMAKELDVYLAYLNLVEAIATKQHLFGLLMDIGGNY